MTDEKETPEAQEAEAPEEKAEAPEEKAEAEAAEEKPEEAEAPEEKAEAEAPEEKAEAEKPAKKPAEVRYTRGQLQRLTTKKLREIALELGDVVGVHGMKKDELTEAIFKLRGREETDADADEPSIDKSALKSEIRELKVRRDTALESGDSVELKRVRKRIKRLKRTLRQAS